VAFVIAVAHDIRGMHIVLVACDIRIKAHGFGRGYFNARINGDLFPYPR